MATTSRMSASQKAELDAMSSDQLLNSYNSGRFAWNSALNQYAGSLATTYQAQVQAAAQSQAQVQAAAQSQAQAAAARPQSRAMAPATSQAQAQQAQLLGGVASKDKRRQGTLLTGPGGLAGMASTIKKTLLGG